MGVVYRAQPRDAAPADRDQAAAAREGGQRRARALRAGGPAHRAALAPEHGGGLRLRPHARRRLLLRDGVPRRPRPRHAGARGRAAAAGPRRARAAAGRLRAHRGPRDRADPPRRQAREHHPVRARRDPGRGQGRGLRPGPRPRARRGRLAHQPGAGHAALPVARGDHARPTASTRAAISTRSGRSATSCSPGSTSSRARRSSRCAATTCTRGRSRRRRSSGARCRCRLEALVLACLEKDPARRPASASVLRESLGALAPAHPWSEDDARAWWERWRERPDRAPAPKDAFSGTLAVSLLGRSR